jgi:flagellar FliL protein
MTIDWYILMTRWLFWFSAGIKSGSPHEIAIILRIVMNVARRIVNALVAPMLVILALFSPLPSLASDHGGGGGGAPEPMVFTVNLGKDNYLQFGLILEPAKPEAAGSIAAYKPRIQHEIILLLSGKEVAELRTLEGKKKLVEEIIELANHAIHGDEESGVKEALFTRFLIQ